jgi:hypothetical protein
MKLAAKFLVLASSLICLPGAVQAAGRVTGVIECTIKDANLNFSFNARFDYAGNTALFAVGGNFESKSLKTSEPLKKFPLTAETLLQQWFYDTELKLHFYNEIRDEGSPFSSVDLVLLTRQVRKDELHYTGTYELDIQPAATDDSLEFKGKAACSMN